MNNRKIKKITFTALFTALCTILSMLGLPSPIGGYFNPGDCVVLLGTFLLGSFWGAAAAGVGSALADILLGYAIYAPATLVIKAAMAICAGLLMKRFLKKSTALALAVSCFFAELIMILGYFIYQSSILGLGLGALLEIPGNCVQGLFGALAASVLYLTLRRSSYVKEFIDK